MFSFTYGSKTNLVDFLHWDNFVLAHYLAAKALHDNPTAVVNIIKSCVNYFDLPDSHSVIE